MSRTANECRGEDSPLADVGKVGATQNRILQSVVELGSKFALIHPMKLETVVFDLGKRIDQPFLEEAT